LGLVDPEIYTDVLKDAILDPETADAAFEMDKGEAKALLGSLGNWYAVGVTNITESPQRLDGLYPITISLTARARPKTALR